MCTSSGFPVAAQITVYPSIALPPSEAGAVQLTTAEPSPGVAVTFVGAPGTSPGGSVVRLPASMNTFES